MRFRLACILAAGLMIASGLQLVQWAPDAAAYPASPVKWTRYANNPVLSPGPPGSWDQGYYMFPDCVLQEQDELRLYYTGYDYDYNRIGVAVSTDGVSWARYSGNPVLDIGGPGSWDDYFIYGASVLRDGPTFKMWYSAGGAERPRIGYATSPDGLNWTKHASNPVMGFGAEGAFDEWGLYYPSVLKENGVYKLWYSGYDGDNYRICHAESSDGITWTRYAQNPVLDLGATGSWDCWGILSPKVLNISGKYRMWYTGSGSGVDGIGYANSPDGKAWTRYRFNPVLKPRGTGWEGEGLGYPALVYNGTAFRMWYAGFSSNYRWKIGYAEGENPFLKAPTAEYPVNNTWVNSSTPTFKWRFNDDNASDFESGLQLQMDDESDFGSVEYDSGWKNTTNTSYAPVAPVPDGFYYWRVRAWTDADEMSDWSPSLAIGIDTGAPSNPTGLDSTSHPLGNWSSDPVINVTWALPEGGDPLSGYQGFSVGWDTNPSTVPDDKLDLAASISSLSSPRMPDSAGIYFHIRAQDRAGNWNTTAAHLGPFWVDSTPPGNPSRVQSPDHQPSQWSNLTTIDISWNDADAGPSGVAGYSFLWDNDPSSVPDTIPNATADTLHARSPPLTDRDDWYFHLRTGDLAGNWAPGAVTSGPYFIDTAAPVIRSLRTANATNITASQVIGFLAIADDPTPGSGVRQMRTAVDDGEWSPWSDYRKDLNTTLAGGDGNRTVLLQVRDGAGNPSQTASFAVLLDTASPLVVSLSINNGAPCTNSTAVALAPLATDLEPSSGLDRMSFSDDGVTWGAWESYSPSRSYDLTGADGVKRVYVRIMDRAGNIGAPGSSSILLDTRAPATSILPLNALSDEADFTVGWQGIDVTSGVQSYDIQYKEDAGPWTDWLSNTTQASAVFTGRDGHRYSFRARSQDKAGNTAAYPATVANSVLVDIPMPVISVLKPADGQTLSGRYIARGTASHPKAGMNVTAVQVRLDGGGWQPATGTGNWLFILDTYKLDNGEHTLHVRAFDGTKYSEIMPIDFTVRNEKASMFDGILPWIALMVVTGVVVGVAGYRFSRRRALTGSPVSVAPIAKTPQPPPTLPGPAEAPEQARSNQVPTVLKVSVEDLEREPGPVSPTGPPSRPVEEIQAEASAKKAQAILASREAKILKSLSSLPRGLPSSLWGMDLDDLASKVVSAERKDSPEGDLLVRINNRWYHGDETDLGLFMQEYKR